MAADTVSGKAPASAASESKKKSSAPALAGAAAVGAAAVAIPAAVILGGETSTTPRHSFDSGGQQSKTSFAEACTGPWGSTDIKFTDLRHWEVTEYQGGEFYGPLSGMANLCWVDLSWLREFPYTLPYFQLGHSQASQLVWFGLCALLSCQSKALNTGSTFAVQLLTLLVCSSPCYGGVSFLCQRLWDSFA